MKMNNVVCTVQQYIILYRKQLVFYGARVL